MKTIYCFCFCALQIFICRSQNSVYFENTQKQLSSNNFPGYFVSGIKKLNDFYSIYKGKSAIVFDISDSSKFINVFLINKTDSSIFVLSDLRSKDIIMVQEAKDLLGTWRPIEFFYYDECFDTIKQSIEIPPDHYACLVSRRYKGTIETEIRFKIESENGNIYSIPFKGSVNKEQFMENTYLDVLLKNEKLLSSNKALEAYKLGYLKYREGNYLIARDYCRLASSLDSNWGEPYILVGMMYVSSSIQFCRDKDKIDSWCVMTSLWAAIDEFEKAKSIDITCRERANDMIYKYIRYIPSTEFLELEKHEGNKVMAENWIQQMTTVRIYRD